LDDATVQRYPKHIPLSLIVGDRLLGKTDKVQMADDVTREASYLFEKSIGQWRQFGFNDSCWTVPVAQALTQEIIDRAAQSECFAFLYSIAVAGSVPIRVSTYNSVIHQVTGMKTVAATPEELIAIR
jgi:hypothetical protein